MKSACDPLSSNLELDNLAAWTEVEGETLVTQHLSEEDMATSLKNGKTNYKP
jgi:hypothetical protein